MGFHNKQNLVALTITGHRPQGTKSHYPSEQVSMRKIGIYASNLKLGLMQLHSIGPF